MSDEMNDRGAFEDASFARANGLVQTTEADDQIGDSVREKGIAYGVEYNNHYNFDKYPFQARYQEGDLNATRTVMWSGPGCHQSCGIIFYTDKDGRLVKTEGDPNNPYTAGRLCMRCLELPQMVNNPRRLTHPVKRAGERGEGKWERISWDEAYDMIIENVHRIQRDFGPESIVSMIGTGRNVSQAIAHNQYANFGGADLTLCFLSGDSCMLPRTALCYVIMGNQWVADMSQFRETRYEDDPDWVPPECIVIWGTNPAQSDNSAFWRSIIQFSKSDAALVVIDPRRTQVAALAKEEHSLALPICAKIEEDITDLSPEEKLLFLEDLGLEESGLDRLIRASYDLLGLISYLTAGKPEVRAWTITKGTKAPQAAGKIHSDFERGFIRAEVVAYQDLIDCGSMAAAREKGLVRSEGKDYVVADGDIILFRFNV